jgi:adenylate cyclase
VAGQESSGANLYRLDDSCAFLDGDDLIGFNVGGLLDLRDVLSLQGEIARAIANEIRAKLTPDVQARLTRARPVDPEAYRLYLQGRYQFSKRTLPAFERSIQLFQQVLEKDPDNALAYAGLAESYGILPFYGGALPKDAFPKAKAAALKALELDSSLAEAHAALGFVLLYWDWDWSAAESELKRAIELKPSYVVGHHWYGEYLSAMGRHEQAIAEIRRAQELDPLSSLMLAIGGEVCNNARRHDIFWTVFHRPSRYPDTLPPASRNSFQVVPVERLSQ